MGLPSALAALTREPRDCVIASDFDGTLATIVEDPADAVALPAALDALRLTVERFGEVVVISGRPAVFLRDRVPIERIVLVGQYGLERIVDGQVVVDERALPYLGAVASAAEDAVREWPGLRIERKGDLAFTIHWRTTPELAPDLGDVERLAQRHGLVAQPGRMASEVRTPVPVDKGSALAERLVGYRGAVFVGDDLGDLSAFDALDAWASHDPECAAVRIAVGSAETPPELVQRADLVVDGPVGVTELLRSLAQP